MAALQLPRAFEAPVTSAWTSNLLAFSKHFDTPQRHLSIMALSTLEIRERHGRAMAVLNGARSKTCASQSVTPLWLEQTTSGSRFFREAPLRWKRNCLHR